MLLLVLMDKHALRHAKRNENAFLLHLDKLVEPILQDAVRLFLVYLLQLQGLVFARQVTNRDSLALAQVVLAS